MSNKWQDQPIEIRIEVNSQDAPQWLRLLSGVRQLEQVPSSHINGNHQPAQAAPAELIGRSGYALYRN